MDHYDSDSRAIVLEYLLHYCHQDSAKALVKEMKLLDECSNSILTNNQRTFDDAIDWKEVKARKEVYENIKSGNSEQALSLLKRHFPNLMDRYANAVQGDPTHFTIYKLYCQQFIEITKLAGALEAIEFARAHLRPFHEFYTDYTHSITSLIAYKDLEHEKIKNIMSQEHRDEIADQINRLLLETRTMSAQTALEKLWRQNKVVLSESSTRNRSLISKVLDLKNSDKIPL
ncbi:CTLH/CRA C-terminal to lish motif domain-containing protein [Sporodiniella umbellata]|nr:CTLH/CRA C-terminal to lish motif domain-containing protein [Sporodiniella umbellata]